MAPVRSARSATGFSGPLGVLDIGSSKIACLIAETGRTPAEAGGVPRLRVLGAGYQQSQGVKAGVVVDLDRAEEAVRAAVGEAERMAGLTLDGVTVAVASGRLKSHRFRAKAVVETGVAREADVARVLDGGRAFAERHGRMLVHLERIGFSLDGAAGVRDPRGMATRMLAADLVAVTADEAPLRNLTMLVERCHLAVDGLVAAPVAAATAATTAEERRLGVVCLDIGGGATMISAYAGGQLVMVDAVPMGGNLVTYDIARALQTPLAEAERVKVLNARLVAAKSDVHEIFSYPLAGEDDGVLNQMSRAQLSAIVLPRMTSLIEHVSERLVRAGLSPAVAGRVVLTGGASQTVGLPELVARILDRPARAAATQQIAGLPDGVARPMMAVAAGLAVMAPEVRSGAAAVGTASNDGYLRRVGAWLREGF